MNQIQADLMVKYDQEVKLRKAQDVRDRLEAIASKQEKLEAERLIQLELERKEKEAKEKAEEEQRLANLEEERKKREEEERVRKVAFAAKRAKVNAEKQAQLIKKINAREEKDRTKQNSNVEIKGRTILKTNITRNKVTLIYVKVEYNWGGKFFFIEDEPGVYRNISEQFYNLNVKL